jgi:histidine triad (HIT) family protein
MSDCLFCKIISGEIPSTVVYQDDTVYAFNDINPKAPVHVVVIPKKHIDDVRAATNEDDGIMGALLRAAAHAAALSGVAGSGFRVVANAGQDAGQSVDHLHLHVLGGRPLAWPPG